MFEGGQKDAEELADIIQQYAMAAGLSLEVEAIAGQPAV